MEDNQGGKLS